MPTGSGCARGRPSTRCLEPYACTVGSSWVRNQANRDEVRFSEQRRECGVSAECEWRERAHTEVSDVFTCNLMILYIVLAKMVRCFAALLPLGTVVARTERCSHLDGMRERAHRGHSLDHGARLHPSDQGRTEHNACTQQRRAACTRSHCNANREGLMHHARHSCSASAQTKGTLGGHAIDSSSSVGVRGAHDASKCLHSLHSRRQLGSSCGLSASHLQRARALQPHAILSRPERPPSMTRCHPR